MQRQTVKPVTPADHSGHHQTVTTLYRLAMPQSAGAGRVSGYGNGFKPSSLRKALCLSFATAIAFSISTSDWYV